MKETLTITRSSKMKKQYFFKSLCELNYGSICFEIFEVTDEYSNGDIKIYDHFSRNDGRYYTDIGRRYFRYDNKKKFDQAIKRTIKKAEAQSINPVPKIYQN